jgi:hypothetical protein
MISASEVSVERGDRVGVEPVDEFENVVIRRAHSKVPCSSVEGGDREWISFATSCDRLRNSVLAHGQGVMSFV